jgi:outer membrane protein OmpA-like peptidoglycan-associated protein
MNRLAATAALVLIATARTAVAEPDSGVDAQLYRPALDPFGVLSLDGARGLVKHDFSLKVGIGFGQDPLRVAVPGIGPNEFTNDTEADSVLKRVITANITAAFALSDRLSFGFDVGVIRTDTDDGYGKRGLYSDDAPAPSSGLISLRPLSNIDPSGNFEDQGLSGPTDARLGIKYRLLTGNFGAALITSLFVPFGDEEMFLGDADLVFEPRLALELGLGKLRLIGNLAAKLRKRTVLEAFNYRIEGPDAASPVLDLGSELVSGGGVVLELLPQLSASAEATMFTPLPASLSWGDCTLNDGRDCDALADDDYYGDVGYGDLALQVLGGINFRASTDTTIAVAGGRSAFLGDGRGETLRLMVGINWQPSPEGARTVGRGDVDGDSIPDQIDVCPDEPEDRDRYQDDDGCPDLDNDGDGVIDANDKCASEPEDRDGFADDDGCPERDNDGDGVSDVTDRCPSDAEDVDQFEDDDGCPEEDNDGDNIADAKDKCPNEPETVNGVDDLDGCPDQTAAGGPQMDPTRINLRGARVEFAGSRNANLTRASRAVLDDVAKLLTDDYPSVRVRVEVHVPLGTKSKTASAARRAQQRDRGLAQDRAAQIVRYLVDKGVAVDRIQGAGIGSAVPINPRDPSAADNERVEFVRIEQ